MSSETYFILLAAVALPLIYYIWKGWSLNISKVGTSANDFFVADRKLSLEDYQSTTVAYGLQMAAIVLFAQWGYYYGYWAFIVPIAWCVGFILLAFLAPKFISFFESTFTLHGYISKSFDNSKTIIYVASIATVLGLGGALFAELKYVATLIDGIVGSQSTENLKYFLMAIFLLACLAYVLPGGLKAVVSTDTKQLPIAYLGIATLLASICYILILSGNGNIALIPLTIGIISFIVIFVMKLRLSFQLKGSFVKSLKLLFIPTLAIMILLLSFVYGQINTTQSIHPSNYIEWSPINMPFLTVISLIVANALWQLIDLSSFQRLSAINLPADEEQKIKIIRKGILWTALESPISWCLGISIGIALGMSGIFDGQDGAWSALDKYFSNLSNGTNLTNQLPVILRYSAFGLGLISFLAIMLSTVDSLGSAISFTTTSDLVAGGKEADQTSLTKARIITVVLLLFIWLALVVWENLAGEGFDLGGWLYIAYAMQLSLFGAIMAVVFKIKINKTGISLSIIGGVLGSSIIGGLLALTNDPDVYTLPPLIAVGVSLIIIGVFAGIFKFSKK